MNYAEIIQQARIYFSSALDLEFVLTVLNSEASKLWAKGSYVNIDYDKIETVANQTAYEIENGCIVNKIQNKILVSDDSTLSTANFSIYEKQLPTDVIIRSSSWYPISATTIGIYLAHKGEHNYGQCRTYQNNNRARKATYSDRSSY